MKSHHELPKSKQVPGVPGPARLAASFLAKLPGFFFSETQWEFSGSSVGVQWWRIFLVYEMCMRCVWDVVNIHRKFTIELQPLNWTELFTFLMHSIFGAPYNTEVARWCINPKVMFIYYTYNVGPPFAIAKLVNTTSITMVCDTYCYSMGFIHHLT